MALPSSEQRAGEAHLETIPQQETILLLGRESSRLPQENTWLSCTWLNAGENDQQFREKLLQLGVAGQMGASFSVSVDHWPNAAFARSLPSLVRQPNSPPFSAHTIFAIRLPNRSLIRLYLLKTGERFMLL